MFPVGIILRLQHMQSYLLIQLGTYMSIKPTHTVG